MVDWDWEIQIVERCLPAHRLEESRKNLFQLEMAIAVVLDKES
jgi:hypothetical protein